jgi:PAS domain S-box-containing protein
VANPGQQDLYTMLLDPNYHHRHREATPMMDTDNLSFWDTMQGWAAKAGAITALAAAAYSLYRAASLAVTNILKISERIQNINDQLSGNGGSSLHDAIHRIEGRQIHDEQRQRAFLHHHPMPMFELTNDLNLKWANSRFLKTVGFDSDDMVGYGWHNSIHHDDREKVVAQLKLAKETTRNMQMVCQFVTEQHGVHETYVISATVLRNANGQFTGFFVNLTEPPEISGQN